MKEYICRLCANRGNNYRRIFSKSRTTIVDRINNCLPIMVQLNDKLPAHICDPCLKALKICDKLRTRCLIANSILRRELKVLLVKFIKQEPVALDDDNETNTICANSGEFNALEKTIETCQDTANVKFEKNNHSSNTLFENDKINEIFENYDNAIDDSEFQSTIDIKEEIIAQHNPNKIIANVKLTRLTQHFDVCNVADFICSICKNRFGSLNDLLHHRQEIHENVNDANNFRTESIIEKSLDIRENTNSLKIIRWPCKICKKQFKSLDNLNHHKAEKHASQIKNIENIDSDEDSCLFIEENDVEDLIEVKKQTNVCKTSDWICAICHDKFKSSEDLKKHKSRKHNRQRGPREDGHRNDSNNLNIDVILENSLDIKEENESSVRNTGIGTYCEICDLTVDNTEMMELHQKLHKPRPMYCYVCYRTFPSPYDLYIHKKRAHMQWPNTQVKWFCDKCEKMLPAYHTMERHLTECAKEKYQCQYCDQAFFYKKQLIPHQKKNHYHSMRQDPNFSKFKCASCNRSYCDRKAFTDHLRWHRFFDNKKYTCNQCNKAFIPGPELKRHIKRNREKDKTYKCDACYAKFPPSEKQKKKRAKKDEKDDDKMDNKFTCSVCRKHFGSLSRLDKHLRETHNRKTMWFALDDMSNSPQSSECEEPSI